MCYMCCYTEVNVVTYLCLMFYSKCNNSISSHLLHVFQFFTFSCILITVVLIEASLICVDYNDVFEVPGPQCCCSSFLDNQLCDALGSFAVFC